MSVSTFDCLSNHAFKKLRLFISKVGGRVGSKSASSVAEVVAQIAVNHAPCVQPAVNVFSQPNRNWSTALRRHRIACYEGRDEVILIAV